MVMHKSPALLVWRWVGCMQCTGSICLPSVKKVSKKSAWSRASVRGYACGVMRQCAMTAFFRLPLAWLQMTDAVSRGIFSLSQVPCLCCMQAVRMADADADVGRSKRVRHRERERVGRGCVRREYLKQAAFDFISCLG